MKIGRLLAVLILVLPTWAYAQSPALDFQLGAYQSGIILENPRSKDLYVEHWGYLAGLHYQQPLGKKITLRSGLRFLTMSYKTRENEVRWPIGVNPDTGLPIPDTIPDFVYFIHQNRYLEIPFLLRYNLTSSKLSIHMEMGFGANLYLDTKNITFINGEEDSSMIGKDLRRNHFEASIQAGFGLDYKLDQHWGIFLQPYARVNKVNIDKDWAPDNSYLYGYGVNLGSRFLLN